MNLWIIKFTRFFSVQSQILKSNISISNRQFGVSFVKQKFEVACTFIFLFLGFFKKRFDTKKDENLCFAGDTFPFSAS